MVFLLYLKNLDIKLALYFNKIYGIGVIEGSRLCKELGFSNTTLFSELTSSDKKKLNEIFSYKKYKMEGVLKKYNHDKIKKKKKSRCYQGVRHLLNLPVHGQNTKNNAKTQKWKKKNIS